MIINNFVVTYLAMVLLSLGVCIPAAYAGWSIAIKWKPGQNLEAQTQLEKKVYLVIVLILLGFSIRLFMIPLWFLALQSLVPSVPGAMCMAGLHQLDAPVSYFATILKFFIPFVLIYWLVLNSVDRRIESQPFLRRKLMLVVFFMILIVIESFLDVHFLHSIRPRIVSCCTSMFDLPHSGALKFIRQHGVIWIILFYASIMVTLLSYAARFVFIRSTKIFSLLGAALSLVSLILMLHTKVSPLMLEAPYHQCIFCLWQGTLDIAVASGLVILGLCLTFACALIPDLKKYPQAARFIERLKLIAVMLYSAGALWLTLRFTTKYFFPSSTGV